MGTSDSHAVGVLQLQDNAYYTWIKHATPDDLKNLALHAPEAARAFKQAAKFISLDTDKGVVEFDDVNYKVATHSKNRIHDDLGKYKSNEFVQNYFVAKLEKKNGSYGVAARYLHMWGEKVR